ncbi:glycosyltransferase family A protein [Demequina sp. NBRC 110054]|uniref:glycosyltransferase family 2 protein n=1 Tax=Demequina sp. NBRC 110054 TaxID=1570343 RepID=UPI0009FF804E|nr:glycosyltransferase family A protein [Demequina sp. NBRC 110054]
MKRLTVIICNYNYADFVGPAIESALAIRWPDLEVIVVDDGSTDGSREVIRSFGDSVTAIFQPNGGQHAATNVGFAASSGDVVVFLDSDDLLEPGLAEEVAAVWRPGVSKVQFPMIRIDREGRPKGGVFPDFDSAPTPEEVRRWMRATAAYPTPPGTGNAYDRGFLERLFPIDDRLGDAPDSLTLAAAPFLGDVLTVTTPLARYRIHGANDSNLLAHDGRFAIELDKAYRRHLFAQEISGTEGDGIGPLFRGRHLLQLRVAHRRLRPDEHPIPGDSALRMARDALTSPFAPGPETLVQRVLIAGWSCAVLVVPRSLARRLVRARFAPSAGTASPDAVAAV